MLKSTTPAVCSNHFRVQINNLQYSGVRFAAKFIILQMSIMFQALLGSYYWTVQFGLNLILDTSWQALDHFD